MQSARKLSSRRRQGGFTLIELLLATAAGAIVLLVINGTFIGALRLRDATHASIDHDLTIQRALNIVRRDLEGIMIPPATTTTTTTTSLTNTQPTNRLSGPLQTEYFAETSLDGTGERVSPDIYTSSGRIDGWSQFADVQGIAYYLTPAEGGVPNRKNLVRLVTRNLLPPQQLAAEGEAQVILHDVISVSFSYFDGTNWMDTWDSTTTNTLPSALRFSMVVAPRNGDTARADPGPVELVVPVLVKTTQTATDEAAAAGS